MASHSGNVCVKKILKLDITIEACHIEASAVAAQMYSWAARRNEMVNFHEKIDSSYADLGRFRYQRKIPTPIPRSQSFIVNFSGIGVGIVGVELESQLYVCNLPILKQNIINCQTFLRILYFFKSLMSSGSTARSHSIRK